MTILTCPLCGQVVRVAVAGATAICVGVRGQHRARAMVAEVVEAAKVRAKQRA